jgi:hypothetical protein
MTRLFSRLICLFEGHDDLRECDADTRTFRLRCATCGRGTSGWTHDANEPVVTAHGYVQRHVIFNPRLGQAKRKQGVPVWLRAVHERRGA